MTQETHYKKYAFISYNHLDVKMAKWLHRKLESYKLPSEIHNEIEDSRYLRPIFRDQEDLSTGVLADELKRNLVDSKFLIVICSPNSAKSKWVSNEVQCFIDDNRIDRIIPFVIDGKPNSDNECFPFALRDYFANHPEKELLGINISEIGRQKAFVRVVSKMLDVSFDELWRRHERERERKVAFGSFMAPIVLILFYWFVIPISLKVKIVDDKHHLPMPKDAILTINGTESLMSCLDTTIQISSMPGYYRFRKIPISFRATYYNKVDTIASLAFGIQSHKTIRLKRDKTFAIYSGKIMDEEGMPIENAKVLIENRKTVTDKKGYFSFVFPTKKQTKTKRIKITKTGKKVFFREDESPGNEILIIMHEDL